MKFDVVLGNPPFKSSLHLLFVQLALNITKSDGKVLFVHPANWLLTHKDECMLPAKNIRKKIYSTAKSFTVFNGNPVFKIKMTRPCVISLLDKEYSTEQVVVESRITKRKDIYPNLNAVNKFGNIKEYYSARDKILSITKKDNLWNHIEDEGIWRVPIPRATGSSLPDPKMYENDFFTFITRDVKPTKQLESSYNPGFSTKEMAENFIAYLKTNIARFALAINKSSLDLIRKQLKTIPWLDFSEQWTNEKLIKEFKLTDEECLFIETIIPVYYS